MESKGRYYFDIEATNLLDDKSVDYTASPWKLKDNFKIHCIVATDIDTLETFEFVQKDVYTKFKQWAIDNVNEIISHNGINYDMLVCKVALGMPYKIYPDTWCGKSVVIHDTLVLSKVLNPDRRGHSIEYFGQILGFPKIDWRSKAIELGLIDRQAERGAEFSVYHPEMLVYCKQDVLVGCKTFQYLMKEWGDWKWQEAYDLEKAVAEIITRQSHRGFWFNMDLAKSNIAELDQLMQERKDRVEPNLPQKPMCVTKLKQYIPPKEQFLKNGKPNSFIQKWAEKHGGSVIEEEGKYLTTLYGKKYILPIEQKPIVTHEPAAIDDTTFIKEVLVGAGWQPTQYKEKDLTVDTKKQKLSLEKYAATVERYVTQTLSSAFCKDRCDKLGTSPARLKDKLLRHDLNKPLKVFTNPTFTVGQEKEIDPALESLADSFPYVRDIIEYLTYKHRRNSILGGGMDVFEDDEDDFETGFIPNVRTDGRIPTPADSCGCATGRMKHKGVANIPRVTSLYGANMRALFGVSPDDPTIQFAYDFASLEARIEADYCWRYDQTKEYCNSLLQDKPLDVHTVTARKIEEMIGQPFTRTSAKSVKYASTYGAQAHRIAKTVGCDEATGQAIFDAFWEAAKPLAMLKENVLKWWQTKGDKKFIPSLDGRKINTRSQHALLNSLFQSAGVICAKRVMVVQDRLYAEAGIGVDFWTEDWKNKDYIQQMIAYHDEAQYEVTKNLVKWKSFIDKEQAKQWLKDNPQHVGIVESKGRYFVAQSIVSDIAFNAVQITSEYYKLNVPLAIDPQYGRSWRECH